MAICHTYSIINPKILCLFDTLHSNNIISNKEKLLIVQLGRFEAFIRSRLDQKAENVGFL